MPEELNETEVVEETQPSTIADDLAAAVEGAGEGAEGAEGVQTEETTPEPIEPPEHWKHDLQETFRGLDPVAQSFLMDRHKEMEAAHTQRSQEIAPFRQAAERWAPYLQQIGDAAPQAFDRLMSMEYAIRRASPAQRGEILMNLAREVGAEFPGSQQQPSPEDDPLGVAQQVRAAVAPLYQAQQHQQYAQQQYAARQQQAAAKHYTEQVSEFADAKGEDGKPLRPYFDQVRQKMSMLAQATGIEDLDALYDEACWSTPDVRKKIQAAEARKAKKAEQSQEAQRTQRVSRARGGVTGAKPGRQSSSGTGTIREELEKARAQLVGA